MPSSPQPDETGTCRCVHSPSAPGQTPVPRFDEGVRENSVERCTLPAMVRKKVAH